MFYIIQLKKINNNTFIKNFYHQKFSNFLKIKFRCLFKSILKKKKNSKYVNILKNLAQPLHTPDIKFMRKTKQNQTHIDKWRG